MVTSWKNVNTEYIKPELRCWLGREFIGGKGKYIVYVGRVVETSNKDLSYMDNAGYVGWLANCDFWIDEHTKIGYDQACKLLKLGLF